MRSVIRCACDVVFFFASLINSMSSRSLGKRQHTSAMNLKCHRHGNSSPMSFVSLQKHRLEIRFHDNFFFVVVDEFRFRVEDEIRTESQTRRSAPDKKKIRCGQRPAASKGNKKQWHIIIAVSISFGLSFDSLHILFA